MGQSAGLKNTKMNQKAKMRGVSKVNMLLLESRADCTPEHKLQNAYYRGYRTMSIQQAALVPFVWHRMLGI